jgi:undecaprenyl-diphosphatase
MDLPARATLMDGGSAAHGAARTISAAITSWRTPKRRLIGTALAAAVLSALAFARIAEDYLTNDPLAQWDVRLARWLSTERSAAGTDFFRVLTLFGSPAVALAVAGVVCVVLYRRRLLVEAAFLPVVLGGGELLNLILKLSFHRARPDVAFVHLETYSFPSGHAMISSAAYGALAYLAWSGYGRRGRLILIAGTTLFVALICFSRLYLAVHYLSDVLAGIVAGVFWLAVSIALLAAYGERLAARFNGSPADRLARRVTRS